MWPIDTNQVVLMFGSAEADRDFTTKEPKFDRETGAELWVAHLIRMDAGKPEVIKVKVPGEPKGLQTGDMVRCERLACRSWTNNGMGGMSFRAESIAPVGASSKAAA